MPSSPPSAGSPVTVVCPLPASLSGGPRSPAAVRLELQPQWSPLVLPGTAEPLPPQQWHSVVDATVHRTFDEDNPGFTDRAERRALVLRLLGEADADGEVLLRAFLTDDFCAVAMTASVRRGPVPDWAEPGAAGPSLDDEAGDQHAEATLLSAPGAPLFLRLARDARTADVSPALLIALAGHDRGRGQGFARGAAVGEAADSRQRAEAGEDLSREIWLRYLVPIDHSEGVLALTFRGYGNTGMEYVLQESRFVVDDLRPTGRLGAPARSRWARLLGRGS